MNDKNYYDKITSIIENIEVKNKASSMQEEQAKVTAYWNIGRLIVEVQGGEARAKYGDELIKKWSKSLMIDYGKGYNISNLKRFRKFYLSFSKGAARGKLSWTHYKSILPIKNKNERNYYINLVILNKLSTRELQDEIKNKAFDRLSYADKENIKLVNDGYNPSIKDLIKDPILINSKKRIDELDEKALHRYI